MLILVCMYFVNLYFIFFSMMCKQHVCLCAFYFQLFLFFFFVVCLSISIRCLVCLLLSTIIIPTLEFSRNIKKYLILYPWFALLSNERSIDTSNVLNTHYPPHKQTDGRMNKRTDTYTTTTTTTTTTTQQQLKRKKSFCH